MFSLQYVSRGVVSVSGTLVRTTPVLLHLSKKHPRPGVTPPLHSHTDVSVFIMFCTFNYKPDFLNVMNCLRWERTTFFCMFIKAHQYPTHFFALNIQWYASFLCEWNTWITYCITFAKMLTPTMQCVADNL